MEKQALFGNLIDIGIKSEMEFYQKREARIVNLFSLITIAGLLIGVTTVFFISGQYPTFIVASTFITSLLILVFNAKERYNLASYLFVISINFTIFIINQHYQVSVGSQLYYFPVVFCVALIHNPLKSNTRTIFFFAITLLSFAAAKILDINFLKLTDITSKDTEVLSFYNSFLAIVITVVLVFLVVKLINRQNNEAITLLNRERASQIKISQSLKEKDVLLAEIQHRVKNNLAVITGLLNLQTEKAPCEVSKQLMVDSRNRVMSMAMVHNRLYKKDNLSNIDLKLYLSELVKELALSFPVKTPEIEIVEDMVEVVVEITTAVPIGLIINEAITNSLKHAFDDTITNPIIKIKMEVVFDKVQIILSDNGLGFPEDRKPCENSLGLSLIESLSDQIDASVSFTNNSGAAINLLFMV
jgi:two-component sensor histidine kinase